MTDADPGATLLDPDDLAGLRLGHITTHAQLNLAEKNIGCDPSHIGVLMHDLCESAKLWFEDTTSVDEVGCRFHHQIVAIHPFVNGNGRLARFATDLLMSSVGAGRFSWGSASLAEVSQSRSAYIAALRAADRGDLDPLVAFVRS